MKRKERVAITINTPTRAVHLPSVKVRNDHGIFHYFSRNIRAPFLCSFFSTQTASLLYHSHLITPTQSVLDHESYSRIDCLGHIQDRYLYFCVHIFFLYLCCILPTVRANVSHFFPARHFASVSASECFD